MLIDDSYFTYNVYEVIYLIARKCILKDCNFFLYVRFNSTIRTSVLTYGALQMQTTYLLT